VAEPNLEEVFKVSGVPTHTFVEPRRYPELIVNLRQAGRGLVIEGPSGIGKTTAIETALAELRIDPDVTKLSARQPEDVAYIRELPNTRNAGVVIVDDFHKLDTDIQKLLADYIKVLADTDAQGDKLIIIGINKAGQRLIEFAQDIVNRIDVIPFEANSDNKVEELITKGEAALNVTINVKKDIVREAQGSFYIAQLLSRETCLAANHLERANVPVSAEVSFELIRSSVWERLGLSFESRCLRLCRGTRLRRGGRAPYLHILRWLAQSQDWTISLQDEIRRHDELRGSVGQVVDKGFLSALIEGDDELQAVLHFDDNASQLTIEDPQFFFYIHNIPWRQFADKIGFISVEFESRYDFALSFAGPDRDIAEAIADELTMRELETFYDRYEQHRILAEDIEEYLKPIYQSEASFVIVLLGREYPKRVWTKFESDVFRERFNSGAVIPIWFSDVALGVFDESRRVGGYKFDRAKPQAEQVEEIANLASRKLQEVRSRQRADEVDPTDPVE
jgi:hypothetical protein